MDINSKGSKYLPNINLPIANLLVTAPIETENGDTYSMNLK